MDHEIWMGQYVVRWRCVNYFLERSWFERLVYETVDRPIDVPNLICVSQKSM
jgi:hypothetical protein